jgi:hypothetical protein
MQLFIDCFSDFGIHLAEFTVDSDGPLPVRQLASVLLKQYVETHWCNYSSTFQPPETTEHAKVTIKELLPLGLKESISKVCIFPQTRYLNILLSVSVLKLKH